MGEETTHRLDANEYAVKRIAEDTFELWQGDKRLATLTKKEAWPVMIGKVHPETIIAASKRKQQQGNTLQ